MKRRATEAEEPKDKYRHDGARWWLADCDCGGHCIVNTKRLRAGAVTGCGCRRLMPEGDLARNMVYAVTRARAKRSGKAFTLTLPEFLRLVEAPCTYCGAAWSSTYPNENAGRRRKFSGAYRHNGIDRIDSAVGYVPGNCAPACKSCNVAKAEMSVEEFKAWIRRVHDHFAPPLLVVA